MFCQPGGNRAGKRRTHSPISRSPALDALQGSFPQVRRRRGDMLTAPAPSEQPDSGTAEAGAIALWKAGRGFSTGWTNRCGNVEKGKVRKMHAVPFRPPCTSHWQALLSPLRRVRDVSRSKPRPEAVGGSRKSAGEVDESEIGSANGTASFGRSFHLCAG